MGMGDKALSLNFVNKCVVSFGSDPKSTDKEFRTLTVVEDLICVAQVNKETRSLCRILEDKKKPYGGSLEERR